MAILTVRGTFSRVWPAILASTILLLAGTAGENKSRLEYESGYRIKAACLYNFAKFIEWPRTENAKSFTVGILGNDPFGDAIDKFVQQKSINGRSVVVRRLLTPEQARECDLVYLGSPEMLANLVRAVEHSSVLTVGESAHFTNAGGMIGFVVIDDNVRFDVNTANTTKAGLLVSSRLLQLARTVVEGTQGRP
jgi:hypothetical protein